MVFDRLIPTYDKDLLIQIIMCLFSICVLNVISNVVIETLTVYIKMEAITHIRIDISESLLRFKYSFFSQNQPGEIVQRVIPEIDCIGGLIAETVKVISFGIQIVLILIMVAAISIPMASICIAVLTVYSLWYRLFRRPLSHFDGKLKRQGGELYDVYNNVIENIKTIKLFGMFSTMSSTVTKKLNAIEKDTLKFGGIRALFDCGHLIFPLSMLIITGYCFHQILHETMTIGYYLVFTAIVGTLSGPINVLLGFGGQMQAGIVSAGRIDMIRLGEQEKKGSLSFKPSIATVSFENVSFSYNNERPVLHNIRFSIQKGQHVAIIGSSGSGKSTIAQLLVRLYEPTQGRIMVDGQPLSAMDIIELRNKIGLLSQDVFLFNGTIKENVNPNDVLKEKEVRDTLSRSRLTHFESKLMQQVGESGQKLSGGERQRVALARLLGRACEIVILDEPTSSLDPKTALEITQTFHDLQKENPSMTFITITHNLENLYLMDSIIVLENGAVVAEGNYNDLCQRKIVVPQTVI